MYCKRIIVHIFTNDRISFFFFYPFLNCSVFYVAAAFSPAFTTGARIQIQFQSCTNSNEHRGLIFRVHTSFVVIILVITFLRLHFSKLFE